MRSRLPFSVWLSVCGLLSVVLWFGCEQKGDVSPTGSDLGRLTFIDTVIVDPPAIAPGETADIQASIRDEANEPAPGEEVRFSVTQGMLGQGQADTTVVTDNYGLARSVFTSPGDSGTVLLRTELIRMSEIKTSTISVSGAAIPADGLLSVWSDDDTLFADNGYSRTSVYARLRNSSNNPIPNAQITFSTSLGSITSPAYTDSASGIAVATLTSTSATGDAEIIARNGDRSDTVNVAFLEPMPAALIEVTSTLPSVTVGLDSTIITARVYDENYEPVVDNTNVLFTTTNGVLSNLTARTVSGVATTTLYPPTVSEDAVVIATTGGDVSGSVTVEVNPGAAASITVASETDTLSADNYSQTTITATVEDGYGNPVSVGTSVIFTAIGGTVTNSSPVGPDGVAYATFKAGSVPGPSSVSAVNGTFEGSISIYLRATLPASVSLNANPLQIVADGVSQSTLRALVLDNQSRPVSDGTWVTFTAEEGQITGTEPAISRSGGWSKGDDGTAWGHALKQDNTKSSSFYRRESDDVRRSGLDEGSVFSTTTANGIAQAVLISSSTVDSDEITAEAGEHSDAVNVTYIAGDAANITIVPGASELPADGISSTTVTFTVTDAFGNAVRAGLPISVGASRGTISPSSGFTNTAGSFVATLATSRDVGLCMITATSDEAGGYGEVLFSLPQPSGVVLTAGSPAILADGISSTTITARVKDEHNLPVQGAEVEWELDAGIGSLVEVTSTTDADGNCTAIFYSGASTTDVSQAIQGTHGDYSDDLQMIMKGVTVTASADDAAIPADGESTTNVDVLVRETTSGTGIEGAVVRYAASAGAVELTAVTNSSGVATAEFRSGQEPGTADVTCLYGDTLRAFTSIYMTDTEADRLATSLDDPELLANGTSTTTITAVAYNEGNDVVSNVAVTFTALGSGSVYPEIVMTDEDGIAVATYTSAALLNDEEVVVDITIERDSEEETVMLRGVNLEGSCLVSELPANGTATAQIRVDLREVTSQVGIANAQVLFGSNLGTIPASAVTNESGVALVTYQTGTTAGTARIIVRYGNLLTDTVTMTLYSLTAANIELLSDEASLLANGISSTQLSAGIVDQRGEPIANIPVQWNLTGSGELDETVSVTDQNGIAGNIYVSAASPFDGEAEVFVTAAGATDSFSIGLRGVTVRLNCSDTVIPANGVSTTNLTVQVRETANYEAIPNATVYFGTSSGSIQNSSLTNESGIANATLTADDEEATAMVICRYGNRLTDTLYVEFYEPVPANMVLTSASPTVRADGVSSVNLTAAVYDEEAVPLSGEAVAWSAVGAELTVNETYTDENGQTSIAFMSTASSEDAAVTITAASGDVADQTVVVQLGVTIDIEAVPARIAANGITTSTVTVHLYETTSEVPIGNQWIVLGTSIGSIPGAALTNSAGIATTTLMSSPLAGIAVVEGSFGSGISETTEVTFYEQTPAAVALFPEQTSLRADGVSSTEISAYIYDEEGLPISGEIVSWSATGVEMSMVQSTTDSTGLTTVTFRSTPSEEDLQATITATAGSAQNQTHIAERGVTIGVTAVPNEIIADGSSTSQIRVHLYETTSQIAITNEWVSFGTNLGSIPSDATTNSSGIAAVLLTAGTQTGTAVVRATFGTGLSANVAVDLTESTPTNLSLTSSRSRMPADNVSSATLTAVVTDQNGNPVPDGTVVHFDLVPASGSLGPDGTTVGGIVTNTLTSSSNPDTVTVRAVTGEEMDIIDSVTIIYEVGEPAVMTLSAETDSLPANGIAVDTITAYVTDVVGHPLSNVGVEFSTTIGSITSNSVTNANGTAKVAFSSTVTGTARITATAGEAEARYTLYLLPDIPNSIIMSYYPGSVGVRHSGRNETLLITATVLDANNNPVLDGTEVNFDIYASPPVSPEFPDCVDFLSSEGPIPTINGHASTSYSSGCVSGTARIRASCTVPGGAIIDAVSTEIIIYAGPPYIGDVEDGCNSSHTTVGSNPCSMYGLDVVGDSVEIVALVGDRYRNPVTPGTAVYFTTSGGIITTNTGYTNEDGFARVTLYSGHPLPTVNRWLNTILDPNTGEQIFCTWQPDRLGIAKVIATTEGVDEEGNSAIAWDVTNVRFDYSESFLSVLSVEEEGAPTDYVLYIGDMAQVTVWARDLIGWPLVYGSTINFSASTGLCYPSQIVVGCPADTTYSISFFNNLSTQDDDAASPVLIQANGAYTYTGTFTLYATFEP